MYDATSATTIRSTDGSSGRRTSRSARHDSHPSLGDELGEATGGISGVLVGAGIGSAAGPIGTLIGGIAGALGGWWAGRAVAEAATSLTHEDDEYFRAHYLAQPEPPRRSRVRRRARRVLPRPDREPQSELPGATVRGSRAGARGGLGRRAATRSETGRRCDRTPREGFSRGHVEARRSRASRARAEHARLGRAERTQDDAAQTGARGGTACQMPSAQCLAPIGTSRRTPLPSPSDRLAATRPLIRIAPFI